MYMDKVYQDILEYFKTFESNDESSYNKLIAWLLRDIYVNDMIYVTSSKRWKEYKMKRKLWEEVPREKLKKKISNVCTVLTTLISKLVDVNLESTMKKSCVFKIMKIIRYLSSEKYDIGDVELEAIQYFKV